MRLLPTLLFACAAASCGSRAPHVTPAPSAPKQTLADSADFPTPPLPADPSRIFVGTPHPFSYVDSDPRGKWVLLCQARKDTDHNGKNTVTFSFHGPSSGDTMELFLINERGAGEKIEGFVTASPTGDHLVLLGADGRLLLRNTRTNSVKDLSFLRPDTEPDLSAAMPQAMVRFDPTGRYLVISQEPPRPLIVMEVESGAFHPIDPGPGVVWKFLFDNSAKYIFLEVVVRDANGNGVLDLPRVETNRSRVAGYRCDPSEFYSHDESHARWDQIEQRAALISGSRAFPFPQGALSLGAFGLAIPDGSGGITLRNAEGAEKELVPSDCDGWIWDANAPQGMIVMACGAFAAVREANAAAPEEYDQLLERLMPKKAKLVAFSPTGRRPLATIVPRQVVRSDPSDAEVGRLLQLPTNEDAPVEYLDVSTWKTITLRPGQTLCAEYEAKAYVAAEDGPTEVIDLSTGAIQQVTKQPCGRSLVWTTNPWLLADNELVDMERGVVVGSFPDLGGGRVIDASGRVLTFAKEARLREGAYDAAYGPLEWIPFTPRPPAAPAGASR